MRRHLSAIKGGRLAAACHPARVVTLLISDVPGDDPIDIASGPTVADPTTCADALDVVRRYGIDAAAPAVRAPARMRRAAKRSSRAIRGSRDAETRMIATPQMALEAAAAVAARSRVTPRDPRRRDRRRGARRRQGDGGHRAAGRARAASRSRRPACCCRAARRR